MSGRRILWVDLRLRARGRGLAHDVPDQHSLTQVTSFERARDAVRTTRPAVACVEFDYPDAALLSLVPKLIRMARPSPVLMFTEYHSEALAVQAFRWGVWDYRVKPVSEAVFARDIEFAAASSRQPPTSRARDAALPDDLVAVEGHLLGPVLTTRRTAVAGGYIAERYAEPISRKMMARACHLSESEFTRVFRREHECTFETYLLDFRIGKARGLLATSSMTITQVAQAVGFNDSSYFSRAFRRTAGMTASGWRRLAHGHPRTSAAAHHEAV